MTWDPAPIAVAFSGGGDSLALLLAADTWAKAHGRRLLALTVDHGLRPESVAWTRVCQERARALGVDHRALAWTGDKPVAGVPAAARDARHRLLAEAAREAGAAVILMGHTADDCAEAAVMRRTGSTTPSPRRWSPSPVWPQGRGIFLLRPFLGVRRAALRAALTALGESWIDDPGNIDPGSARARARAQIAGGPLDEAPTAARARPPGRPGGLGDAEVGPAGNLFLPVRRLADPHDGANLLGAALLCAAGSERTPRRKRLQRLVARLTAGERFAATLAGARVESDGTRAHIVRDAGDVRRPAMEEIMLREGRTIVWDGRFEVAARSAGLRLGPLCGRAGRLTPRLREAIAQIPPSARRALPLAARADGVLSLPTLRPDPAVDVRPLAPARLAAARGAILDEGTLRRMAKSAHPY
ncbi:MAG TPA: tRNA lysidine(34) synthetase TilS [Caulobacteraceae bacterium]|nr:tRNA lysidine(34) synthetase TilS [Caulobacteraceae bacterium]